MKLQITALVVLPLALSSFSHARPQDAGSAKTPAGNPDANGHYHVGDGVTAPRILHYVDPEYTDEAQTKRIGGVCLLSLTVDEAGTPQNIRITRSIAELQRVKLRKAASGLDASAFKAVAESRFQPGTLKGQPVPVDIHMDITFRTY